MRHLLKFYLGVTLLAVGWAACNTASLPFQTSQDVSHPTTKPAVNLRITVWSGNPAHLALLNEIADAYQDIHPDVTVQFDTIPFGDYTEKVTVQLTGENPPDAGWIVESSALAFIEAGALVNLNPVLKQNPNYDFADFSEPALQLWVKDNAVYGIPFSTSPFFIFYNRNLFRSAGIETPDVLLSKGQWTWQTLAEVANNIANSTPPEIYGFESLDAGVYDDRVWNTLIPIIWAYGGDAWDAKDARCRLNTAESVEAVQLYHKMVFVDGSAVPPGEDGDFYSGRSAMTIGQLSRVARLQDASFEWDIVPLPHGPAGEVPVIGQAAIAVFEAGKHKKQAADFAAFMTTKENVRAMAQFFPPARLSVLESDEFLQANKLVSSQSIQQTIIPAIHNGRVLPAHANFPEIDMVARPLFKNLWVSDANIEAVLTEICTAITPLLKQ